FGFGIGVSTDYGASYDLVYVGGIGTHIESTDYAEFSVDLSAYAGETATVVIQAIRNSGDFYFDLDNIKVGTPPANAVFAGASELDFGVTFLGGSFTSDYVVNNIGGADLHLLLGTASAELVVTGLPATVAPGTSDTLSVTFTPAVIDTVDYAGSFELTTNDFNNASVSVAVSSEVRDPNPSDYIDEDFESVSSGRPAGWAGNMSVRTSGGVNFSQRLTVNLWSSVNLGQITTPFVNLGDTPEVSFQYRVVDYTGYPANATSAADFDFGVFVSTDYGANYDLVYLSSDAAHTESTDYAEVSVDLSAYSGETALVAIQSVRNSGDFFFDMDNIKVGTPPSYPIFAADDSIEYGTTYTNETYPVTFVYSNPGGADLEVALESASPELTISGLPSTVAPGTTDSLTVTFAPSAAGAFEGSFILTTNDTASDTVTISVTADVQAPPPVASISPESISETLAVNASTTVDLTLSNNGSGQDLTYMVSGYGSVDSTASTMSIGSTVERDLQEEYERSVIADWQNGSLRDLSVEQEQIIADYQNMIANESSYPAPGLQNAPSETIEFTDFQASGANIVQVATSGTYNGSIESVTADFVLNSATGGTWADDFMILLIEGDTLAVDGSNFVAQIGGFSTFSAVKYGWGTGGSGTAGTPVATTIDIDPAIAAENLSVWIGNGYASGGTTSWTGSVSLNGIYEQPSFVTDVSPANGSIAASASETITVTLDATGLVSGQFTEMLYISTNDPEAGFLGVPITLDVIGITPEIAVEDTVMFPTVYTGDTASASVIINSTGDADLEITNITFDNGQFSADSTNYVIQGGQSAIVNLSFASSEAGTVSGTMTIESNAVSGSATVYLEAMALNPPVAAVDTTSITFEARSGDE
ncbi:MAG: choice-of-anchor D domain-containing protein, partial [Balneolaceae bacterium]